MAASDEATDTENLRTRLAMVENALSGRNGHVPRWALVQGASLLLAAVIVGLAFGPTDILDLAPYAVVIGLLTVTLGFAGLAPILVHLDGGESA